MTDTIEVPRELLERAAYFLDLCELDGPTLRGLQALLAQPASVPDEVRRDAERYRWLRDRIENKGDMVIAKVSEWSIESWSGDDPDAAIDAAMATKEVKQ